MSDFDESQVGLEMEKMECLRFYVSKAIDHLNRPYLYVCRVDRENVVENAELWSSRPLQRVTWRMTDVGFRLFAGQFLQQTDVDPIPPPPYTQLISHYASIRINIGHEAKAKSRQPAVRR
jgi:hypothetical protein